MEYEISEKFCVFLTETMTLYISKKTDRFRCKLDDSGLRQCLTSPSPEEACYLSPGGKKYKQKKEFA